MSDNPAAVFDTMVETYVSKLTDAEFRNLQVRARGLDGTPPPSDRPVEQLAPSSEPLKPDTTYPAAWRPRNKVQG